MKHQEMSPQAYTLQYDDTTFYITSSKQYIKQKSTLIIDRETCKTTEAQNPVYLNSHKLKKVPIALLLGIITIKGECFLAIVTKATKVVTFLRDSIFNIRNVSFLAFRKSFGERSLCYGEIIKYLDSIRDIVLNDNFYYCYHINLTLSQQKFSADKKMDRHFFWNQAMLDRILGYKLSYYFRIPVIQGYVGAFLTENEYFAFQYIMISRRSKYMSGTRFYSRGIDTSGRCANYVETEQIIVCHNYILSYVHLRGSLPVFWAQSGFGAPARFPANSQNHTCTPKHYKWIKQNHGEVVTINLLSTKQGDHEKELSLKFEQVFKQHVNGAYVCFDLNEEIKSKNDIQAIIDKFIKQYEALFVPQNNFFVFDYYKMKTVCLQKSFNRINCLDCLDRTNVIMFKISEIAVRNFCNFLNKTVDIPEKQLTLSGLFKENHRDAWLENGDRISMIYSGTPSVASYITKGDKNKNFFSTIGSGIKSFGRFVNANINDDYKQECLNYVLCQHQESLTFYFADNITRRLPQVDYCSFEEVSICILSWNCNQVDPSKIQIERLLNFQEDQASILAICLQQMVELNTYNVLIGSNKTTGQVWRENIEYFLRVNTSRKYTCIVEKDLVGVYTIVFVAANILQYINNINWSEIKTGFKGNLGNKGAIIICFNYDDSPISIINCHLEAGEGKVNERLDNLENIHLNAFPERLKKRQFQNNDFRFLAGDLNFRIDLNLDTVREMLYNAEKYFQNEKTRASGVQLLNQLLLRDELTLNRSRNEFLSSYQESTKPIYNFQLHISMFAEPIQFMPTYKYVKGTNEYDYKSKRTPAWCDRILYFSLDNLKIMPGDYGRRELNHSDHKPVICFFKLLTKKEDKQKKQRLIEKYMEA